MSLPYTSRAGALALVALLTIALGQARAQGAAPPEQIRGATADSAAAAGAPAGLAGDSLRVYILEVRSDGRRFFPVDGTVTLPRGWRNLEVRYQAAGAPAGSYRYRTRLEGFDEAWVEMSDQDAAYYRNLPAGTFTFRVQAVASTWARESSVPVVVPPFPRETWWFWLMVGLLGTAGALVLYVLRTARIIRRTRELERVVLERTRDLHAQQARTEEALATAERERENARQALETVREQSQQLVRMDQLKSRFFANISHELRTPLTLVLGTLDDAERGSLGEVAPALRDRLRLSALNARRLLRLINELLDLAKLEAGGMELTPAAGDLVATAREVVRAFGPLAEREGVALRFAPSVETLPARFDRGKVEHVLFNLLSNALKVTPAHGKVLVALDAARDDPGGGPIRVTLRVQDTGPGIAPEVLPQLFDRFFRADVPGRFQGAGTGLGLALARELTELHGGTIRAESTEGFGSTFTVELELEPADAKQSEVAAAGAEAEAEPIRRFVEAVVEHERAIDELSPEADAGAPAPRAERAERPLVLVVEDNAEVLALLREYLSPHFRVLEAGGGEAGLALAGTHRPDVILSDVAMEGMDGFEFARRLRRHDDLADTPLVFLTARASEKARLEGLGLGADDYITKPFDGPELVARLANLVDTRRRLRARYATQVFIGSDPVPVRSADAVFLERAHAAVEARLADEALTVGALALELGVSEAHLKRKLRALAGESPVEFIRARRLERAAALLAGRAGSVADVAAAVGFGSASYFSRCFRERYGVVPSDYEGGESGGDRVTGNR